MNRKEELQAAIRGLYAELHAIEGAERDKENAALIGRCFRTRNKYSCPQSDDERWWLYLRVNAIKDGHLEVLTFQNDKQGRITIEQREFFVAKSISDYQEISQAAFTDAWLNLLNDIAASEAGQA